eukprot:scaffold295777_cov32-Prasinocladus_malaysianus.AAC.1
MDGKLAVTASTHYHADNERPLMSWVDKYYPAITRAKNAKTNKQALSQILGGEDLLEHSRKTQLRCSGCLAREGPPGVSMVSCAGVHSFIRRAVVCSGR